MLRSPRRPRDIRILRTLTVSLRLAMLVAHCNISSVTARKPPEQWTGVPENPQGPSTPERGVHPGRGILIVGEGDQLANAYVNLRVLREELKCTLPVEVVYSSSAEAPRPELHAALSAIPGVRVSDITQTQQALGRPKLDQDLGFFTKIYALAFVTNFSEVLLLDSDNLPLLDPNELFDSSQYREFGNLFWPDWWRHSGTILAVRPELYEAVGLPVPWAPHLEGNRFRCAESGQVLFNRERHKDVLMKLWWLATQHSITSQYVHGDKDLYRVAFALTHKAYQQVELPARNAVSQGDGRLDFMGMVQLAPDGRPAFHHRTGPAKYIPHHAESLNALEAARVAYLSSALSHDDAYRVVGRYWWSPWEVDIHAWEAHKCDYNNTPVVVPAHRDVPELWCTQLGRPHVIPMYPLDKFGKAGRIITAAHELVMRLARQQPSVIRVGNPQSTASGRKAQ